MGENPISNRPAILEKPLGAPTGDATRHDDLASLLRVGNNGYL